jgi:hypothetical protein
VLLGFKVLVDLAVHFNVLEGTVKYDEDFYVYSPVVQV